MRAVHVAPSSSLSVRVLSPEPKRESLGAPLPVDLGLEPRQTLHRCRRVIGGEQKVVLYRSPMLCDAIAVAAAIVSPTRSGVAADSGDRSRGDSGRGAAASSAAESSVKGQIALANGHDELPAGASEGQRLRSGREGRGGGAGGGRGAGGNGVAARGGANWILWLGRRCFGKVSERTVDATKENVENKINRGTIKNRRRRGRADRGNGLLLIAGALRGPFGVIIFLAAVFVIVARRGCALLRGLRGTAHRSDGRIIV